MTLLATSGDCPENVFCHCNASDGAGMVVSLYAELPAPFVMKTHVLLSAGLIQTAGTVRTTWPCARFWSWSSPPTWPGPPWPLMLLRLMSRTLLSLPD